MTNTENVNHAQPVVWFWCQNLRNQGRIPTICPTNSATSGHKGGWDIEWRTEAHQGKLQTQLNDNFTRSLSHSNFAGGGRSKSKSRRTTSTKAHASGCATDQPTTNGESNPNDSCDHMGEPPRKHPGCHGAAPRPGPAVDSWPRRRTGEQIPTHSRPQLLHGARSHAYIHQLLNRHVGICGDYLRVVPALDCTLCCVAPRAESHDAESKKQVQTQRHISAHCSKREGGNTNHCNQWRVSLPFAASYVQGLRTPQPYACSLSWSLTWLTRSDSAQNGTHRSWEARRSRASWSRSDCRLSYRSQRRATWSLSCTRPKQGGSQWVHWWSNQWIPWHPGKLPQTTSHCPPGHAHDEPPPRRRPGGTGAPMAHPLDPQTHGGRPARGSPDCSQVEGRHPAPRYLAGYVSYMH